MKKTNSTMPCISRYCLPGLSGSISAERAASALDKRDILSRWMHLAILPESVFFSTEEFSMIAFSQLAALLHGGGCLRIVRNCSSRSIQTDGLLLLTAMV